MVRKFGTIPQITCYPNQLNQVFMNLLVNAGQAIEGRGTITIETTADEKCVYVSIVDTGKGIPSEQIGKIFDPGFTTKGVGVGTGLGLSISYNIVEKHGGVITAKSKESKGAAFTVALPLDQLEHQVR